MPQTEYYMLHGLCLRLLHVLAPSRRESMTIGRWIADHADIFGAVPAVIPAGRRAPGVDPQSWHLLAEHLSERLVSMPEPFDLALDRLGFIAAHLNLAFEEEAILRLLVVTQRKGPLAKFIAALQREIGLSTEATMGWCCNLDEREVWTALAPTGRLIGLGLIMTDNSSVVMRDDAYELSGLLLALLRSPSASGPGFLGES